MPFFNHDGLELFYRDVGAGVPVLLLHGFPLTGASFDPQLARAPDGVRLLVPDLRGLGHSMPGHGPTTMQQLALDGLALLDFLKIERAVVGGVSMGGYATMALVRENPGRVLGLVLIDTQCEADDDAGKTKREETAQAVEREGADILERGMVSRLVSSTAPAPVREQVTSMIRSISVQGAAAALRGMATREHSRDVLARFAGPCLIVVGKDDVITPPEKAKHMQGLVSGSELVEIAGAGHLSNLEQPDAFHAALSGFLRRFTE